jgi:hypothetical protein
MSILFTPSVKMYLTETATSTVRGKVWQAIEFISHRFYFALSNASTAWSNDALPPIPSPNLTDMPEILGYKEVDIRSLAKPDNNGTILFKGQKYSLVATVDGYTQGAYWVYLKASVEPADLPLTTFRSVGLYIDLNRANGVPDSQKNLLPNEVQNAGLLFRAANFSATPRAGDKRNLCEWIIELGADL